MSAILQDQDTQTKAWFTDLFHNNKEQLTAGDNAMAAQFRATALQQLAAERFPTHRDEDWKYSGAGISRMLDNNYGIPTATSIDAATVEAFAIPELDVVKLVFVNGILNEELSAWDNIPTGLTVLPLAKAMEDVDTYNWMTAQAAKAGGTAHNTFLALNRSFATHGIYIKADNKAQVSTPVHCLYINTAEGQAHMSAPLHFIRAEGSSQVSVIESYHATDATAAYFTNAATWVDVAANARVHHYRIQTESAAALQVNNAIINQDRDSIYSSYVLDLGGQIVRNNTATELLNSNTETNLYGVYVGNGKQHIDNQSFIDHAVPHCQSNEMYKGILSDFARGVFNGKVLVRQDAQKINAFQQNSSLVLSPNAMMNAKPQLEIFADDVRCSHGATIGQLDESSVFYLRSRGLSEEGARELLQQAFVGEVLENIPEEKIRDWTSDLLIAKLSKA